MSCAQAHCVGSKPIRRVKRLKLHKPTMAIGYSLRMCARYVDSTNPGRRNLVHVFRSKPIAETEMSNRLIGGPCPCCPHPQYTQLNSTPIKTCNHQFISKISQAIL